jgi:sulfur carrier protein ThiS
MRVRLNSELEGIRLGCWYEIPQKSKTAYIKDLIDQLHSDLELEIAPAELALELEEFTLPRQSRIEGVLRDGDILTFVVVVPVEFALITIA